MVLAVREQHRHVLQLFQLRFVPVGQSRQGTGHLRAKTMKPSALNDHKMPAPLVSQRVRARLLPPFPTLCFKLKGFGWTRWSRQWLYATLRLFNGYRIGRPLPKVAPAG
jgi:hypothetical protein